MTTTGTRGGFSAFTERAKDIIVDALKAHFSLLLGAASTNCLKEMPQIERYGLAGQTTAESFVNVFTALPLGEQRIPFVAIMSAPGNERKLGIGRQVIHTFHDPDTGLPMIREAVGGDMNVIIEIATVDTNQRAELTDIIYSFFTVYMEEQCFQFLGDTQRSEISQVPDLSQIILKSQATIGGETDQPRPEGEPVARIYYNRVTVPIIFLDYVDREASDINARYDETLTLEDDEQFQLSGRILELKEPGPMIFAVYDDMETTSSPNAKWRVYTNPNSLVERTIAETEVIRGVGSLKLSSIGEGAIATLVGRQTPVTSGRIRVRFNIKDVPTSLVLFCMLQGDNPLIHPCYHLIVKTGEGVRVDLVKGPITIGIPIPIVQSSPVNVDLGVSLAAQLEWKLDVTHNRIRIRGCLAVFDPCYGALVRRLEKFDTSEPYLNSSGEGFGMRPNPDGDGIGSLIIDDPEVLSELGTIEQFSIGRVGW